MTNPLGVYIQVPFCASKCTFCNFSSSVESAKVVRDYLASVEREVDLLQRLYDGIDAGFRPAFPDAIVDSWYIGGGTPALAGSEGLAAVLASLRLRFAFSDECEATIETTPGSADGELLRAWLDLGVNRLSIGAQSFHDAELRTTGRLHTAAETVDQVDRARRSGFSNISLDLIAGLPFQTMDSWLASVREALALEPEHLSIYLFEVDEKSRLGSEVVRGGERYHAHQVPGDDFMAEAYERAQQALVAAGYVQYEISNFARPGFESRHNRKYWRLEPYLGLGAGAHSFDGTFRWENETVVAQYSANLARGESPVSEWRRLEQDELIEDFLIFGLRQRDGVDLGQVAHRFGPGSLNGWKSSLDQLVSGGALEAVGTRLRLAPQAYLISNEVFQQLLL